MRSSDPSLDHASGIPPLELNWTRLSRSPGCDGSTAQIPCWSPYTIQPPTSEKMPEGFGGGGSSAARPALRRTHVRPARLRNPIAIPMTAAEMRRFRSFRLRRITRPGPYADDA